MTGMMLALLFLALLAAPALGRSAIKIIGGKDAEIGQFPHQGSMWAFNEHYCGCALVSSRYCLTAAHCTTLSVSQYEIRLGVTIQSQPQNGQIVRLAAIFNHPEYNVGPGELPNDIAILQLAEAADLSNSLIETVPMANPGQRFDGQTGVISGWGYIQEESTIEPDNLQFAEVNVFSHQECLDFWSRFNINDWHICAGVIDSVGACGGDSGGPLTVNGVLIGLTSWGIGGCFTWVPTVYTSIEYYRDWIDGIIA